MAKMIEKGSKLLIDSINYIHASNLHIEENQMHM